MRRLWFNGAVVSMDPAMTRHEAIGVEGGKIVFLGTIRDALTQDWMKSEIWTARWYSQDLPTVICTCSTTLGCGGTCPYLA